MAGSVMTSHWSASSFLELFKSLPIRSSSCQRVCVTRMGASFSHLVKKVSVYHSHILFRIVVLSASSRFLMGSSIIPIELKPIPVIPPPRPQDRYTPECPTISKISEFLKKVPCATVLMFDLFKQVSGKRSAYSGVSINLSPSLVILAAS